MDRSQHTGWVVSIRGSVVDAVFPHDIPSIYNKLTTGKDHNIIIEVVAHIAVDRIRGIALNSTRGLERGAVIIDTGKGLEVPVGEEILGRVFNVFGETIDGIEKRS